ncbi:hypothetical protein TcCL_ESM08178, partial [Trypanosoma cruzi]
GDGVCGVLGGAPVFCGRHLGLACALAEGPVGGECQQELCARAMPAASLWRQGRLPRIAREAKSQQCFPHEISAGVALTALTNAGTAVHYWGTVQHHEV